MPTFTFKLDGVLQLRKRAEQQAQRTVAERARAAQQLSDELTALNDNLVAATNELRGGRLVGSVDVAYLAAHRRFTTDVTRQGATLMQKLALAEREVCEARSLLAEAVKQRRVLETLREKHHARWKAEQQKRELNEADEDAGRWFDALAREDAARENLLVGGGDER